MKIKFNWYTELNKAIKSEPDEETYEDLKTRALSWVTCACGQLCKALPRNLKDKPLDRQLATFGIDFAACIYIKKWADSLAILDHIEARTTVLLQEINTKHN